MSDSPFIPLPSKRVFEQVADQIRKLILAGVFKAGDKLPPEKELAVQFNVGRAALREALRTLEGEGLINVRQGSEGGSFINALDLLTTPKSVIDQIQTGRIDPGHLKEVRFALECSMLEHVIARITDDDLEQLEKTIADARKQQQAGDVPLSDVSTFHLLIARASRNPVYELVLGSMINLGIRVLARGENRRDFLGRHLDQHDEILACLRARDLAGTRKALEEHIQSISRNIKTALDGRQTRKRKTGEPVEQRSDDKGGDAHAIVTDR